MSKPHRKSAHRRSKGLKHIQSSKDAKEALVPSLGGEEELYRRGDIFVTDELGGRAEQQSYPFPNTQEAEKTLMVSEDIVASFDGIAYRVFQSVLTGDEKSIDAINEELERDKIPGEVIELATLAGIERWSLTGKER